MLMCTSVPQGYTVQYSVSMKLVFHSEHSHGRLLSICPSLMLFTCLSSDFMIASTPPALLKPLHTLTAMHCCSKSLNTQPSSLCARSVCVCVCIYVCVWMENSWWGDPSPSPHGNKFYHWRHYLAIISTCSLRIKQSLLFLVFMNV